jgi:hypothetical protein
MAFFNSADRWKRQGFPRPAVAASVGDGVVRRPHVPLKKPSMAFFNSADRWKRQGFPRPAVAASVGDDFVSTAIW